MSGTLLTAVEVAERLGLSSAAVAQAVRMGALQPSARTNDDMLFSERAVAAFAERWAAAASSPLQPPAAGTRAEWSGDLDRLNSWLKDLTRAAPAARAEPAPPPVAADPIAAPEEARPSVDFRRPPVPEAILQPAPPPEPIPVPEPVVEPVSEAPQAPEPEPLPEIVVEAVVEPAPPAPEPVAETVVKEEVQMPTADEATEPLPEPVAAIKSGLSRQAVLVVEPIERFRILRDVADRLATVPGLTDARLERLEGGIASYRLSFGDVRPTGEAIAGALAPLGLQVMLVDSE